MAREIEVVIRRQTAARSVATGEGGLDTPPAGQTPKARRPRAVNGRVPRWGYIVTPFPGLASRMVSRYRLAKAIVASTERSRLTIIQPIPKTLHGDTKLLVPKGRAEHRQLCVTML